jgi:hypothetical protein
MKAVAILTAIFLTAITAFMMTPFEKPLLVNIPTEKVESGREKRTKRRKLERQTKKY